MYKRQGVSKLSGDMRKTDFIVENSVKETGKDTNGNPIYAPNDIKAVSYTHLISIDIGCKSFDFKTQKRHFAKAKDVYKRQSR